MSEVPGTDRGETFIHCLMSGHSECVSNSLDDDNGENDMVGDDVSAFFSQLIDNLTEGDISRQTHAQPNDDPIHNATNK